MEILKGYYNQLKSLPDPLKMIIAWVFIVAVLYGVISGTRNYFQNLKIERLEQQNSKLNVNYQSTLEKQRQAESKAETEGNRANDLEQQLSQLKQKEKLTDAKITTSQQTSHNLHRDLQRIRVSSPANVGTEQLERRIEKRYGQTKSSQ